MRARSIVDKERPMPYAIVHQFPGGTNAQYEATIAAVHSAHRATPGRNADNT